jgi:hypothetical protein
MVRFECGYRGRDSGEHAGGDRSSILALGSLSDHKAVVVECT